MADKSFFDSKNIAKQTMLRERDLLDELNIPPKLATFLRENSKRIQMGVICVVIAILAWSAYDYYQAGQREASAAMLAKATQAKSNDQRKEMLGELLKKYPRTEAALLGKLDLGHMAFQQNDLDKAIATYSEVLEKMSSDNPLVPFVRYSLAQAYENNKDDENAIKQYQALAELTGFAGQGYQGLGRIYENEGQTEKAIESYKKAVDQEDLSPGDKEMLEGILARLQ